LLQIFRCLRRYTLLHDFFLEIAYRALSGYVQLFFIYYSFRVFVSHILVRPHSDCLLICAEEILLLTYLLTYLLT